MRAVKFVFAIVVLLGGVGLVTGARGDPPARFGRPAIEGISDRLRQCGPLRYGEPRDDCVRGLQQALRTRGAPIRITGNYLSETTRYVKQFQAARHLRTDGV